jgi:hypothetical protein
MKTAIRFAVSTIAIGAAYLLLTGVGWAAVFFWKSPAIALTCGVLAAILCPAHAITVVPQSSLDTPLFFVPMMILSFMLWGGIITLIWNRMKRGSQNKQIQDICA